MGPDLMRIRDAARDADADAAVRRSVLVEAAETEAVFVGDVDSVLGEALKLYRTPNGCLIVIGNHGTALAFDPGELERLRGILDRVVMPGQEA